VATSKKNSTKQLIIDDSNWKEHFAPTINGEVKGHGAVPRDFHKHPREMFDPPSQLQVIPKSEWSDRIKEKVRNKSQISDILLAAGIPSLDQDGVGYCWAHSTTGCEQAARELTNQPYEPLSAFSVAATIKKGADEGGWCGLSAQFARQKGIVPQSIWPQGDRQYRKYDKPETWEAAARYKSVGEWVDLTADVYDVQLAFEQLATCLLLNCPCATDFNWWSHSVMACDLVEVESGDFGIRIRNSWSDSYGDKGFAVLRGGKCHPDSALSIFLSQAADLRRAA
jgi:hypothetical protein